MLKKIQNIKDNIHVIRAGATSSSFVAPHIFVKYIIKYQQYKVYEREKHLSKILQQFSWYPKLLHFDDNNKFFIFEYVGVPVTKNNKPSDLEEQFNQILADMKSVNVQHNDIKIGEILINEKGKIYLCDFGWGSINNELGCGIGIWNCHNKKKPGGYHDDSDTLKRLELI